MCAPWNYFEDGHSRDDSSEDDSEEEPRNVDSLTYVNFSKDKFIIEEKDLIAYREDEGDQEADQEVDDNERGVLVRCGRWCYRNVDESGGMGRIQTLWVRWKDLYRELKDILHGPYSG